MWDNDLTRSGAKGNGSAYGFTRHGFFYENVTASYYNIDNEKKYVLCTQPGCQHSNKKCLAYSDTSIGPTGVGIMNGSIYFLHCFTDNDSDIINLISMDSVSGKTQSIARIAMDSFSDEFPIQMVSEVYYTKEYVVLDVVTSYTPDLEKLYEFPQSYCNHNLLKISVLDGSAEYVEQPGCGYFDQTEIKAVFDDCIVYERKYNDTVFFSEHEFENVKDSDPELARFLSDKDPYYAYYEWWYYNSITKYEDIIYDLDSGTTKVLSTGEYVWEYYDGMKSNLHREQRITSYFGDEKLILCQENADRCTYNIYNVKTGEFTELLDKIKGNAIFWGSGSTRMSIVSKDNKLFFYMTGDKDGPGALWCVDVNTGEKQKLLEDAANIHFIGDTDEYYFYYDIQRPDPFDTIYFVSKEDFYSGDLSHKQSINTLLLGL